MGVWYRVFVGPFTDRAAASGVCDKLKAEGTGCILGTITVQPTMVAAVPAG